MTAFTPLKKYRFKVFVAPLFKLIECVCEIAVPFLVRAIIDNCFDVNGSHYHDLGFALGMGGIILGFAVLGFSFTMITQYLAARVSADYGYDLKQTIYRHIEECSPKQIEDYGREKAVNLLGSDSSALQNGVQYFMRLLVRAPFLVLGCLVAGFIINIYAGAAISVALLLCGLVIFFYMKKAPSKYQRLQAELDVLAASSGDMIRGIRVIHGFSKETRESQKFEVKADNYQKVAKGIWRFTSFVNPLTFATINLALIVVLFMGSYSYDSTLLSVGSIVALSSLLTQALAALLQFSTLATNLSKAIASKRRIDAFLGIESKIVGGSLEKEPDLKVGEPIFALENVTLSFGGDKPVLSDFNLTINKGERIGIIGGTGSGKSTFLNLLFRYLDPSEGTVYFKGHPIKESKLSSIRGSIASVSQKGGLFQGSIKDNLTLGLHFDDETIAKALKQADAFGFVSAYPDYLDHELVELGSNLSGGQRQRLLIARALLHKREISFYDDATSALDYATDSRVRKAIFSNKEDTILFVSQRVTSVMGCDRIFVFDDGKIVGEGKHEELLKTCPVYWQTYQAQVKRQ